ncbi:unnamed protein product [Ranitomeya imitator]|uniref:Uncharacterized protein n=1 Tax=Ranitomeya imitator TaxID=111125 RepID=A0ABN9M7Y1_9NEOB|nr:unnamed protein product [Ranitomeya imitator]
MKTVVRFEMKWDGSGSSAQVMPHEKSWTPTEMITDRATSPSYLRMKAPKPVKIEEDYLCDGDEELNLSWRPLSPRDKILQYTKFSSPDFD